MRRRDKKKLEKRRRARAALRVIRDLAIGTAASLIGSILWKLITGS